MIRNVAVTDGKVVSDVNPWYSRKNGQIVCVAGFVAS